MCRSVPHGGRRCPSVNTDRERDLNTARRRRSRAQKALDNYAAENPDADEFNDDQYAKLSGRLEDAERKLSHVRLHYVSAEMAQSRKTSEVNPALPVKLVVSGKDLSAKYPGGMITTLRKEYDKEKFMSVVNRETAAESGHEGPLGKPVGGIWVAPVENEGMGISAWEEFIQDGGTWVSNGDGTESMKVVSPNRYSVGLKDDAKVLMIDSWEDYVAVVDANPRHVPDYISEAIGEEPKHRKGINYEELGVDAIFITHKAVSQCSFADSSFGRSGRPDGDKYESLYGWDFSSGVIMNPDAVEVTARPYDASQFPDATRPVEENSEGDLYESMFS